MGFAVSLLGCDTAMAAKEKEIPLAEPLVESIAKELDMKPPEENEVLSESAFIVGAVLEFPMYGFYLGSPDIYGQAYVPNFSPRLGPRIVYKKIGLRGSFALGMPDKEERRRGQSDQANAVLSFYWKKYAFDFYYQYFKGFYVSGPLTELDTHKPDRYSQLPDAKSTHWGFNWYYNVNATQFSLGSAFDQTDASIAAGESWVIVPFYRHWTIHLGDRIIKGSAADAIDTIPPLSSGTFDTLGTSIAYAKTWTFDKTYISALGGLGPGIQQQEYEDNGKIKDRTTIAGKLNLNLSAGFKPKEYMVGTTFILDSIYAQVSGEEVYSTLVSLEFFLSKRL